MGDETRVFLDAYQRDVRRGRLLDVWRERGFWVVHNRLTGVRRYYKNIRDLGHLLFPKEPAQ